jgi:hypothetical protein
MSTEHDYLPPSIPEATRQVAQTREAPEAKPADDRADRCPEDGVLFHIDKRVTRAVYGQPYERQPHDPLYRPLKIFTLDPSASRLEGSVATVKVPFEPLAEGPTGQIFEVDVNRYRQSHLARVNLEDPRILIQNGRDPSPADPLFHQQMVYAVCTSVYAAFRGALGRHIAWGFDRGPQADNARLRICPHLKGEENAYYDKESGELKFGYYQAREDAAGMNLPKGWIYTCLSHDIVAHEVTHALLDGLRANFALPVGLDVIAFHEAFADLVAVFQHFSYDGVVLEAMRSSRGNLSLAEALTSLARQFGYTAGDSSPDMVARPLRSAIDDPQSPRQYSKDIKEPHDLGSVLVSAVFAAFRTVFERKTRRYVRIATGGTGVLQEGEIPPDLLSVLAEEASKLAGQFLKICIRAIDYCPPVDLTFGEFLRAVITADRDLVPDDPWNYREAWIAAFGARKIYPDGVSSLSEDSLLWGAPERALAELNELNFAKLQFEGDPARPAGPKELNRQACALGRAILQPDLLPLLGLATPGDPRLRGDRVDLPTIHSIRTSRRVGPDGQVIFDLIAEITQRREYRNQQDAMCEFYGGCTLVIGPRGDIRYLIRKSILKEDRRRRQEEFIATAGSRYWDRTHTRVKPVANLFGMLHRKDGARVNPAADTGKEQDAHYA